MMHCPARELTATLAQIDDQMLLRRVNILSDNKRIHACEINGPYISHIEVINEPL